MPHITYSDIEKNSLDPQVVLSQSYCRESADVKMTGSLQNCNGSVTSWKGTHCYLSTDWSILTNKAGHIFRRKTKFRMKRITQPSLILPNYPRRQFIQDIAAGGAVLGFSTLLKPVWARADAATITGMAPVLSGTEFDLTIAETIVNFTGTPRMATTINGSIPAPILRWREGDTVTIRVTNRVLTS